jgi:hypothetical protein
MADEKPQVPPLRFAPVGMTSLSLVEDLRFVSEVEAQPFTLSSRPERSEVEGPAVSLHRA